MPKEIDNSVCCLCGKTTDKKAAGNEKRTVEHVPPKQFFTRELLQKKQGLNLWTAPAHLGCNNGYREDEEYFYHALSISVQTSNPGFGRAIFNDLKRRVHSDQTPALLRRILSRATTITPGGIILPAGVIQVSLDAYRIQQVALKVAQGLHYLDFGQYLPKANCKDIRFCTNANEVPECYSISWQLAELRAVCPEVFSYRCVEYPPDNQLLYSLLFWEAFMVCMVFDRPS